MPWISFSSFHDSPCEDRGHTSWVWEKAQWHSLPAVIMALFPVFFGCPCSLQVRARVNKPRRRPIDGWRSDKYTDTIRSTTFEHEGQKRRKDQRIMSQVRLHSIKVFIGFLESKLPLRNSKVMIRFYWLEYSIVCSPPHSSILSLLKYTIWESSASACVGANMCGHYRCVDLLNTLGFLG